MVDKALLAHKVASIRDAVARIRTILPADPQAFADDRTAREVVTLNLFVALQDALDLAAHWIADAGWDVPQNYRDVFAELATRGVVPSDLAARLGKAMGLRNIVAHRYTALDWSRVHEIASHDLSDLESFCATLAGA